MNDTRQIERLPDASFPVGREGAGPVRSTNPTLSLVTPAFNEADNLPVLYRRLCAVLDGMKLDWEWIVVDDHSADGTFEVLKKLAAADDRIRAVRFSRNFGSHRAIACGLERASGACAVVLAADLQDPPEVIPALVQKWTQGARVVWAARGRREGETLCTIGFSRLYYAIMRHFVGLKEMPVTGADFFLIDRLVVDALNACSETHVSLFALITWMGFGQEVITYDKQARLNGRSGWSLEKKIKLVVDSVTAFSDRPIRLMSLVGILFALSGVGLAGLLIVGRLTGHVIAGTGYVAIMTVLLLGFGFLMTFLGVLGEYVWRTLDEVRGRPRCLIEDHTNWARQPKSRESKEQDHPPAPADSVETTLETAVT